jgi:O-antigen/teichoic acid export membrane protein
MMGSQVVTWVSTFILMLFLPRYLGSVEYGRLYLAISVTMIFQIIIDFGGSYFIAKEISRSRDHAPSVMMNSIGLRSLLWVISMIIMVVLALIFQYSGFVISLIMILGVAKLWEGTGRVFTSGFQGFEMMQYPSLAGIVERVFITSTGIAALLLGANALGIAILMAVSTFLNFAVISRSMRRVIPHLPKIQWSESARLLKIGLPYFLYSVFAVIYYRIDAVMLSLMTPEAVVGWYGAAYRFFDILMFLPSIFSMAVFPVLSRLKSEGGNELARITRKSLDLMIIAGIPISILIFAFSPEIIQLFFGLKEYGPSVHLLKIFSVGLLMIYIDFILSTAIFASDKQRQWTMVALGALLLNPALNYFLIPYTQTMSGDGGIGAAIATLVTEFFVLTMALIVMPKEILKGYTVSVQLKGFAAGLVMILCMWYLRSTGIPWILQGMIGAGIYVGGLIILKVFNSSEIGFVKNFFVFRNLKSIYALNKGTNV